MLRSVSALFFVCVSFYRLGSLCRCFLRGRLFLDGFQLGFQFLGRGDKIGRTLLVGFLFRRFLCCGLLFCGLIYNDDLADGWYVQPTVIEGLAPDCRTNQEEIFGPVVTITPFDTEDEVLGYANGTPYGLSSTLWTENLTRAHRMAERIEAGIVWINCWLLRDLRTPFGGVKQSGVGREGGFEAMRFFTEPKNVCIEFN